MTKISHSVLPPASLCPLEDLLLLLFSDSIGSKNRDRKKKDVNSKVQHKNVILLQKATVRIHLKKNLNMVKRFIFSWNLFQKV